MEKLLWIGSPAFAHSLGDCGWGKVCVLPALQPGAGWADLLDLAGFAPDVTVVSSEGNLAPLIGMEDFPCLTVFHGGGAEDWQLAYAQAFDAALVSSFDKMPNFYAGFLHPDHVWWSPPFASAEASSDTDRQWDCLMVEDENSSGEARNFAAQIAAELPDLRRGPAEQGANARILLLHSAKNELELDVFEAMARGGCVVTPRVKDGLGKIFVDGEQLVAYAPGDAGDALYRIRFLLDRPELREHIARTGREEINASHRAIHRAMAFTSHLCDLWIATGENATSARRQAAEDIREIFLKSIYQQMAETAEDADMRAIFATAAL